LFGPGPPQFDVGFSVCFFRLGGGPKTMTNFLEVFAAVKFLPPIWVCFYTQHCGMVQKVGPLIFFFSLRREIRFFFQGVGPFSFVKTKTLLGFRGSRVWGTTHHKKLPPNIGQVATTQTGAIIFFV